MKTKTKALVLSLCALLLVVTSVFVTMAFLTSQDSVTNTFAVGKVEITLDEAKVTEYGVEVEGVARVKGNKYKLIPGHTYVKDPTIHVSDTSEDCYLFVKIENGLGADAQISGLDTNGWKLVDGTTDVYCYCGTGTEKQIVQAGSDKKVFDQFTFGEKAEPSSHQTHEIKVTAYAIQADGFEQDTVAEIWAQFK